MPILSDTTEQPIGTALIAQQNTGFNLQTVDIVEMLERLSAAQNAAQIVHLFSQCSDATGGYVQLNPQHHFFPVLTGSDNSVIPLYHFVEVMDEVLDYDLVQRELPSLSFSQIASAIAFLRRLSQSNPNNIDLDELEDIADMSDAAFLQELRNALADKETSRVLDLG